MSILKNLRRSIGGRSRRRRERQMFARFRSEIDDAKILAAGPLVQRLRERRRLDRLTDAEFKVFSQFGDDGIIQYLIHYLQIEPRSFVEFGVEDYRESNTRFLLTNDNWRGLVMDGSAEHVASIRADELSWRHDLTAAAAFITRENIESLLAEHGFDGELGLLSIDIDGNDYWVWKAIECVAPPLVIAEYNSVLGGSRAAAVPYDPAFDRTRAHYSNLYWGCSVAALCRLAGQKGYAFVGCNSAGNNAYFVREDAIRDLSPLTPEEGYVESRFRESRDAEGRLTYLAGANRLQAIADLPVVDVETGEQFAAGELAG